MNKPILKVKNRKSPVSLYTKQKQTAYHYEAKHALVDYLQKWACQ